MNYAEQIAAFENKRAANVAAMKAIMDKAAEEGATLDKEQQEEFDGYEADNEAIDAHLKRLRSLEKVAKETARQVNGDGQENGSASRAGHAIVLEKKLPPGIRFARAARCIALAHLQHRDVAALSAQLYPDDHLVQKAAVAAGSTESGGWGSQLVGDETSVFADFVEYLRPMTIIGRFGSNGIPSLRRVPFRTALIGQSSGGEGYWVGESHAKPLTRFDFTRTTLAPLKVANIAVTTMELLRDSSPSAETILRDQLAAALRARLDADFINPAKAAVTGTSPASITNGVTAIASTGATADNVRADVRALFKAFIDANNAPTNGVWIMKSTTALTLSLMVNPLGQPEFPGITMNGGTFFGLPVLASEHVPGEHTSPVSTDYVILVNASDIYLGDEGGIAVDMSREASLEMDDAPAHGSAIGSPPAGTGASLVSMFQTNSVAFRAERTINWSRRRTEAVQMLDEVAWSLTAS